MAVGSARSRAQGRPAEVHARRYARTRTSRYDWVVSYTPSVSFDLCLSARTKNLPPVLKA